MSCSFQLLLFLSFCSSVFFLFTFPVYLFGLLLPMWCDQVAWKRHKAFERKYIQLNCDRWRNKNLPTNYFYFCIKLKVFLSPRILVVVCFSAKKSSECIQLLFLLYTACALQRRWQASLFGSDIAVVSFFVDVFVCI